jgi:integral membrane sensor domain MASE1
MSRNHKILRTLRFVNILIGTLIAALLALTAAMLAHYLPDRHLIPLAFIPVVLLIAHRFGSLSGVLGTVASAFLFAAFLYSPYGTLHVAGAEARNALNWMLLSGISLSFLFPSSAERARETVVNQRD